MSWALQSRALTVALGQRTVLHGLDLDIAAGRWTCVVGPNGAGKSTLLKVMSGAHRPTTGKIEVNGTEYNFHKPKDAADAGVQMVYQDLALVDPQDIAHNLTLGREFIRKGPLGLLGFLDIKEMRREAQKELDLLGVRTVNMTRPVEMLSGGQRQVVAIARSAVRVGSGGVLLLDEPTAALGYEQTRLVEDLILKMRDRGIGIVLVTHNLPLCFEVADRIVVLNRGRKVADVPKAETNNDEVVGWITGARSSMFE